MSRWPTLDLQLRTFGRLTAIDRAVFQKSARWVCQCSCGTEKVVLQYELLSGKVQSCGCLRKERSAKAQERRRLPFGEASFRDLLSSYKRSAIDRGFSFDLSPFEFRALTQSSCSYCGEEPSRKHISSRWAGRKTSTYGFYTCNGVDRLNSSVGYAASNCVACCSSCNRMKGTLSVELFIERCTKIAENCK